MRTQIKIGIVFALLMSIAQPTLAQNKVVVIPLNDNSVPLRLYYGSVTLSGVLESGNIVSAQKTGVGRYNLDFGESVIGCAVTVSKGSQGGGSSNIYGNVNVSVPSSTSDNFVHVRTRDSTGTLDDTDFHFTGICPK